MSSTDTNFYRTMVDNHICNDLAQAQRIITNLKTTFTNIQNTLNSSSGNDIATMKNDLSSIISYLDNLKSRIEGRKTTIQNNADAYQQIYNSHKRNVYNEDQQLNYRLYHTHYYKNGQPINGYEAAVSSSNVIYSYIMDPYLDKIEISSQVDNCIVEYYNTETYRWSFISYYPTTRITYVQDIMFRRHNPSIICTIRIYNSLTTFIQREVILQ